MEKGSNQKDISHILLKLKSNLAKFGAKTTLNLGTELLCTAWPFIQSCAISTETRDAHTKVDTVSISANALVKRVMICLIQEESLDYYHSGASVVSNF